MKFILASLGAFGLILTLAFGSVASQDEAEGTAVPAGVEARVAQLSFLSGTWEMRKGEDELQEHWSEPQGNCLMGSFRWIKEGGEVWMYEFLTMRNEEKGVTMRFRHFDAELGCWEEAKTPLTLRLVELEKQRAVFEHFGGDDDPWTMTFHRKAKDALTITLAGSDEDEGQEFAYHRPGSD